MKIAILSDIHANYEALSVVIKDIYKNEIHKIICVGDIFGYGPDPKKVINIIKKEKILCTLGNHELALLNNNKLKDLNNYAKESIIITKSMLSKNDIEYIRTWPINYKLNNLFFVHGHPKDNVEDYIDLISKNKMINIFENISSSIVFVGHTHLLALYIYDRLNIIKVAFDKNSYIIDSRFKHIINTGSVGQPRDENKNANYLIYNTKSNEIIKRSLSYNFHKTVLKLKKNKFPLENIKILLNEN